MVNGSIQYQSITYWILNYKFPLWKFKKSNYLQIFLLDNNKHFFNSYYDSDPYYKVKPTLGFTPCSLRPEEKISRHLKETAITKRLFR